MTTTPEGERRVETRTIKEILGGPIDAASRPGYVLACLADEICSHLVSTLNTPVCIAYRDSCSPTDAIVIMSAGREIDRIAGFIPEQLRADLVRRMRQTQESVLRHTPDQARLTLFQESFDFTASEVTLRGRRDLELTGGQEQVELVTTSLGAPLRYSRARGQVHDETAMHVLAPSNELREAMGLSLLA